MNQSMFHISEIAQNKVKVNVILENDYTQQSQRKVDQIQTNSDITDPNSYLNKKCMRQSRTFFNKRANTMNPKVFTNQSLINTTTTADIDSTYDIRETERGGGSQLKDINDHKNNLFQQFDYTFQSASQISQPIANSTSKINNASTYKPNSMLKKTFDAIKLKLTDLEFSNENAIIGGSNQQLLNAIKSYQDIIHEYQQRLLQHMVSGPVQ